MSLSATAIDDMWEAAASQELSPEGVQEIREIAWWFPRRRPLLPAAIKVWTAPYAH